MDEATWRAHADAGDADAMALLAVYYYGAPVPPEQRLSVSSLDVEYGTYDHGAPDDPDQRGVLALPAVEMADTVDTLIVDLHERHSPRWKLAHRRWQLQARTMGMERLKGARCAYLAMLWLDKAAHAGSALAQLVRMELLAQLDTLPSQYCFAWAAMNLPRPSWPFCARSMAWCCVNSYRASASVSSRRTGGS